MDDASAVRAGERITNLDRQRERFVDREPRRSMQPVRERLAFEILENQVVELPVPADVVDGTDVRIVQRGNHTRFVLEALPRFRIIRERAAEDLDGDRAIEPGVTRAVDLAHAARAKRGDDLVRTKARTWIERHVDACILTAARLPADMLSTCTVEAMLLSLRLEYADERHRVAARLGSVDSVAGHARPDRRVGRDRCA